MFEAFLLLLSPPSASDPVVLAQLTIEQRVIIRVPLDRVPSVAPVPPPPTPDWKEKKGPRCIAVRSIRSARIARNGIDLILADSERFRARLERSCRPMDFYSGFYIEPSRDGLLCVERDTIRARSGMDCEIDGFKRLVADR